MNKHDRKSKAEEEAENNLEIIMLVKVKAKVPNGLITKVQQTISRTNR